MMIRRKGSEKEIKKILWQQLKADIRNGYMYVSYSAFGYRENKLGLYFINEKGGCSFARPLERLKFTQEIVSYVCELIENKDKCLKDDLEKFTSISQSL